MPEYTVLEQKIPFKSFELTGKLYKMKIEVAGVTALVKSNSKLVIDNLKTAFGRQLLAKEPCFGLDVLVDKKLVACVPSNLTIKIQKTKNGILLEYNDFVGEINLKQKNGKVVVANESNYNSASFVAIMYSLFMPFHGGFFLHSSAFKKNGGGFVFFGDSGAGKTTVANANKKSALIITDECNIIRKQFKEYRVFRYPFGEKNSQHAFYSKVRSFFPLKKNSKTFLKKIGEPEFVSALLGSVLCIMPTKEIASKLLDIAAEIYNSVPCYEFNFSKENPFLEGAQIA